MRIIKLIFVLIIILLGASFAVLNANVVQINYYFGTASMPLVLLLLIVFIVGIILGLISLSLYTMKLKHQNAQLSHRASIAEKEIFNLRRIPLKDTH